MRNTILFKGGAIMKNPFIILYKLLKKGVALILLSVLTVFFYAYSVMCFFYRLIAMVFAVIGTALTAVDCYMYGFTAERLLVFVTLMVAVALRYLLPLLVPVMQRWNEDLQEYIYAPLIVRSPVRYTI